MDAYKPPRAKIGDIKTRKASRATRWSIVVLAMLVFAFGSMFFFSDELRTIGNPSGRGIAFGLGGLVGLGVGLGLAAYFGRSESVKGDE